MFYIHKSKFEYQEVGVSSFDIHFLLMGPMLPRENKANIYFCLAGHPHTHVIGVSLITGLLITGLDWTGILKFVFTHCGMQFAMNN